MKKLFSLIFVFSIMFYLIGCSDNKDVKRIINGNMKTYYEMTDDSWCCDDVSYKYRLEIKGRLNNAAKDSVYVYLSNIENITFEQAWKASGLSSNTNDYFSVKEAVLVECK